MVKNLTINSAKLQNKISLNLKCIAFVDIPNFSMCSCIYMFTSLLQIFIPEKEKQCRFIVNNSINQLTNKNIMWDVTCSRVTARKTH